MAEQPVVAPRNAPGPLMAPPSLPAPQGLWAQRYGNTLVLPSGAPLPAICMKCGARDNLERREQRYSYAPRWIFFLFIFGLLGIVLGGVLVAVMSKRGNLSIPLCRTCAARWRSGFLANVLGIVGLFVGIILSVVFFAADVPVLGLLMLLAAIAAPITIAFAVFRPRIIRCNKIQDMLMTLDGFHPDALAAIEAAAARPAVPAVAAAGPAGGIAPPA